MRYEVEGRDWPNRQWSRFVQTDRLRFHAVQQGEGPDIVLLHGVGGSTHCWAPLIDRLVRHGTGGLRVTAVDLPGHGFTEAPDDARLTPAHMAEDIAQALALLGCANPVALIGHSAGAALALLLAVQMPQRPRLVLGVNPSLVPPDRMPMPGWLEALARPFVRAGAFAAFWAQIGRSPRLLDKVLASTGSRVQPAQRRCYQHIAASPAHVHAALTMMVQWQEEQVTQTFAQIQHHTDRLVLLAGAQDRWIPPAAIDRVAQRIAGAQVVRFEAGHLGPEDAPDFVASWVEAATS
jgi:magnesium chelatase accessory protein